MAFAHGSVTSSYFHMGGRKYGTFSWTDTEIGIESANTEWSIPGLPRLYRVIKYALVLSAGAGGATKFNPRFMRSTAAALAGIDDMGTLGSNAAQIAEEPYMLMEACPTLFGRDRVDVGTATGAHYMTVRYGD